MDEAVICVKIYKKKKSVLDFGHLCASPEPAPSEKAPSHCGFSQASCSGPNVSSAPGSSTPSSSHSSALLQDPALLRQLLPALQATLHINNSSVDMAKINEGERACSTTHHTVPRTPFTGHVGKYPAVLLTKVDRKCLCFSVQP